MATITRAPLTPGTQTPWRDVPASIPRPEYVGRKAPARWTGSDVQDADTIERMRVAGRIAAQALQEVGRHVVPGVSTDTLDRVAHDFLVDHHAYPSTLGYRGFPKSCCTSLNEVICHGIPDSTVVADGDIVNVDITTRFGGFCGDCSITFVIGAASPEALHVVDVARRARDAGIAVVRPGAHLGDVGAAVEELARAEGCSVVREYGGHGIGRKMHADPHVAHTGVRGQGLRLRAGMIFTVEPMVNLGGPEIRHLDDGWTVVTADGTLSAQFEHTVLVTDGGHEILTVL
jgi:methionyl aminopeptidase